MFRRAAGRRVSRSDVIPSERHTTRLGIVVAGTRSLSAAPLVVQWRSFMQSDTGDTNPRSLGRLRLEVRGDGGERIA